MGIFSGGALSLLNPAGWFGYRSKLSGGNAPGQATSAYVEGAEAGVSVTPLTALQLETYWACVRLLAQTIGTLPLFLYNVAKDESRTKATDHPLFNVLAYAPNPYYTAPEFWEGVGAYLATWGNAYALKLTATRGVIGLQLLRSEWMNVFQDRTGEVVYRYADPFTSQRDYSGADLVHFRGFGFGDFVGLSPLAFGANTIGRAQAANSAADGMFRNGMKASGFFKYKGASNGGVLNQEQTARVKSELITPFQGSASAGKTGILPADFDWVSMSVNPIDAELMASRRMSVEEICRMFGVPPVLIGHNIEGQTMFGSGMEHITLVFLTTALRPLIHRIERSLQRDILGPNTYGNLTPEFFLDELLRGDAKGQAEVFLSLVNAGIMTRNEVRKKLSLPAIKGADDLTVNSAMLPVDLLREVAKLPKDKPVVPGGDIGIDPVPPGDPSETAPARQSGGLRH